MEQVQVLMTPTLTKRAQSILESLFETRDNDAGAEELPIVRQREGWDFAASIKPLCDGVGMKPIHIGGVPCLELTPDLGFANPARSVPKKGRSAVSTIVFMHGGGFSTGSPTTHRVLCSYIAHASGVRVLIPDYGLAPERSFPEGLKDCLKVYAALLAEGQGGRIALGGDSAGGGLALSLCLLIKSQALAMPHSMFLMSPWLDLGLSGASLETHASRDPVVTRAGLFAAAEMYRGGADVLDPLISPLWGNLQGLPPCFVQAGSEEVLLDDARRFAERAKLAGVEVTLDIAEGMWHVWPSWVGECEEADTAVGRLAAFLAE
jgi:monoterpene epsilon-lactone hydrolase